MKTMWREIVISGILMGAILYFGTMLLTPEPRSMQPQGVFLAGFSAK